MMTANQLFEKMLYAAYQYYWLDDNIMPDEEYDALTRLVFRRRKEITSKRKELIDWEALENCSSLHYIPRDAYKSTFKY